jgi:hypothetical protein
VKQGAIGIDGRRRAETRDAIRHENASLLDYAAILKQDPEARLSTRRPNSPSHFKIKGIIHCAWH